MANFRAGDGGIDADLGITINGGTVIALGSRNDAVKTESRRPFMNLTYRTTQPAGSTIHITDINGREILEFCPKKAYQSVVYS